MERYSYDLFSLKGLFLRNLGNNWFAGIDFHLNRDFNFVRDPDGILQLEQPNGFDGGRSVALGLVGVHDGRDNVVNAYRGHYFEASAYFYRSQWGSQFSFQNINLIHQTYKHLGGKRVLAWQGVFRHTSGEVPFLSMPVAGGLDILRGYPANRFRDQNMLAGQTEFRFGIWKRFGGVVFSGVGDVFANTNDLRIDALKYSLGGGIRFAMNPSERLNIRLDYGIGRNANAFYLIVAEDF
jgi:outer membrane translocation and assembly module TamA